MDRSDSATSLRGRSGTALVTGASGGIGFEIARLLAADGCGLALVARASEALTGSAAQLSADFGVPAEVFASDLTEPEAPDRLVQDLAGRGAEIDVLVNNAGFGQHGDFAASDLGTNLDMMQLNVVTLVHLTGLLLPGMIDRGRGRILNVASTAAFQPGPGMAVYFATKAFVLSYSEAVAEELRGSPVTMTVLCPGATRTGFQKRAGLDGTALGEGRFFMDAAEVARAGFDGMMRGKTVVVPGAVNKISAAAVRFLSRSIVRRAVRRITEREAR